MKRFPRLVLALFSLFALVIAPGAAAAAAPDASGTGGMTPRCESLRPPAIPGSRVQSFTAQPQAARPEEGVPAYCDVSIQLTHPGDRDDVLIQVWLPMTGWNGRFQGTGGAGFGAGTGEYALAPAVSNGYAVASTDGGVPQDMGGPPTWALDQHGRLNQGLLRNFASRSAHDMTVAGKVVTARFYQRPAEFSYFNGCSGGGRQGAIEAQRYPVDYDGILAGAPGINWPRFLTAAQWPQVVLNQERNFPTQCEFAAINAAVVQACDPKDGVVDGVIEEPSRCRFDPRELVGDTVVCDGKRLRISEADARVVRKIWDGPRSATGARLWPGLAKGTSFETLAATTSKPDGTTVGAPFYLPDNWIRYFVRQNPGFDPAKVSYREFERIFWKSYAKYNQLMGADAPDLSRFAAAGGKLLMWHGLADQIVVADGSVDYRDRVERAMGGAQRVDRFFRLFLAPGVDHCGGGNGPAPTDPLASLVDWVERDTTPDTLPAATTDSSGATVTRNLCRYPFVSSYDGHGDPKSASSYRCVRG